MSSSSDHAENCNVADPSEGLTFVHAGRHDMG